MIDEIPDLEDEQSKRDESELSEGMGNVSLREEDVPDMEDIPDMEDEDENLVGLVEEDEDDDAVVQIDKRDLQTPYVAFGILHHCRQIERLIPSLPIRTGLPMEIAMSYKSELTIV